MFYDEISMLPVIHQPNLNRFIIELSNDVAVLDYTMLDEKLVDFNHTHVPFRARGKGHAEALVDVGLGWAKQQDFKIKASCWYVKKFLN